LTLLEVKNTIYPRKNIDCKKINVAHCKTCKNQSLDNPHATGKMYYYRPATSTALYKLTDGPTG
jgi:hypothetical protein